MGMDRLKDVFSPLLPAVSLLPCNARERDSDLWPREKDSDLWPLEKDSDLWLREKDSDLWLREKDSDLWPRERAGEGGSADQDISEVRVAGDGVAGREPIWLDAEAPIWLDAEAPIWLDAHL